MSRAGHCCRAGKSRPTWRAWLLVGLALGLAPWAEAQDFVDFATMSPTAPVVRQRLCYTDGLDVACDGAAGQVTTSGTLQIANLSANAIGVVNVSATGNIQANQFIGDGSGLTGVVAAATDWITSGTTSFVVVSNTGYISLTQGSTNTGWFDPTRGLVTLGVSATGGISGTTGYFIGGISIVTDVTNSLYVKNITNNREILLRPGLGSIEFSGTTVGHIGRSLPTALVINPDSTSGMGINTTFNVQPLATLQVSGTARISSWTAIGANVTATTALDVYGTVSATNIRTSGTVTAGTFVGDGSGLTGVIAAGSDRITSGTTSMVVVSGTGFVSLTQGGTNTGWFDPTRGLVTLGVSATGRISGTTGYFGGFGVSGLPSSSATLTIGSAGSNNASLQILNALNNVGVFFSETVANQAYMDLRTSAGVTNIRLSASPGTVSYINSGNNFGFNTSAPSATLHVSGTTRITSWTAIAANVTPTTELDVYGTASVTEVKVGAGTTAGNSCDTAQFGTIRRNPTTGRIQVCRPL